MGAVRHEQRQALRAQRELLARRNAGQKEGRISSRRQRKSPTANRSSSTWSGDSRGLEDLVLAKHDYESESDDSLDDDSMLEDDDMFCTESESGDEEIIVIEAREGEDDEALGLRVLRQLEREESRQSPRRKSSSAESKFHYTRQSRSASSRSKQRRDTLSPSRKKKSRVSRVQNKGEEEQRIRWDKEWKLVTDAWWKTIGFFVPPAILLPGIFLMRLFLVWPVMFGLRLAMFAHRVFTRVWPVIMDFIRNLVQFPHHLVLRILSFSEKFALRSIEHATRIRRSTFNFSRMLGNLSLRSVTAVGESVIRALKMFRRRLRRVYRRARKRWTALFHTSYTGAKRILYLISLPVRVAYLAIRSVGWAGRLTFGSITSVPGKVVAFVVNSPHIFGQSGKRLVKFVKRNKQDFIDVVVALVFLTVLGMIISGVFFPLLLQGLEFAVLAAQHILRSLARLQLPRLRIPRLNLKKLVEVLPALPLPKLPFPDVMLLMGLRERTFMEKVAYVFSG